MFKYFVKWSSVINSLYSGQELFSYNNDSQHKGKKAIPSTENYDKERNNKKCNTM